MSVKRGLLIVFEGCDRAGKTTQTELLLNYLTKANVPCQLVKFPDRTSLSGKMIDSYLKGKQTMNDQAIHLLFSSNRWELIEEMKQKLEKGITLIVDRYAYSGAAFTAAKGLDLNWCKSCDVGLIQPDQVFFLDISTDIMKKRKDFGSEIYEKLEFQIKVRQQFDLLEDNSWKFIDASRDIETIHKDIVDKVNEISNQESIAPLSNTLWK